MKKFIKAVVVASVLVSASSAFATLAGGTKPGANGTGGVSCPHKINAGLFAATAVGQDAASSAANGAVQAGGAVR